MSFQFPQPNLTTRLVLFLLAVSVIPLILVGVTSYNVSRSVIEQEVSNYTLTLMVEQKNYLELLLEQIESLMANIASVDTIKEVLDDEYDPNDNYTRLATDAEIGYILNGYTNLKGLVSIDIITRAGAHYHVGDTLNIQNIDQEVLAEIDKEALNSEQLVLWSGVEQNINVNSTYKKVITAAKIFKTRDKSDLLREKPIALLLVNYSVDSLYDHFIEMNLGEGSYMMVIDSKNRLIYHPNKDEIGSPIQPVFLEQLGADKGSFTTTVDRKEMLVTYSRSPMSNWVLMSLVPVRNLTISANTIRTNTILVLFFCFLFISLIALGVERTIVVPINRLTNLFKEIKEEPFDWSMRLEETRSDEIGELIKWFNAFLESLQAKRQTEEDKNVAESANRAKSEFLANMSHELRTPLNGILGYAQILSKKEQLTAKQKDGLDVIRRSGEHLLTLINEILDLSKIDAQKMELDPIDFHLPDMLKSLAKIFRMRAEQKSISFLYEPHSDLPMGVHADEKRIRQVLINLLSNAVKFTDEGGIALKVGRYNGKIRFQVQDTGIGITPDAIEEIFQPFKQVSQPRQLIEGTGLGLAISNKLVEMMGGKLHVKSELGEGSTFWFELDLPEVADFKAPVQYDERTIVGFQGRRQNVLIVDDKFENRALLSAMLAPLGFTLLEAHDGQDALNKALTFKPDVILMDIRMPVMDGIESTQRLRKLPIGRQVVIIIISASAFDYNRQQSLDAGGDDFLAKPFRQKKLLELLQTHLGLTWSYKEHAEQTKAKPSAIPFSATESQNGKSATSLITPPAETMRVLFDLAMRGNIRAIIKQADNLAQQDEQYALFATELRQLAKGFKMKEIRAFVKQNMQRDS